MLDGASGKPLGGGGNGGNGNGGADGTSDALNASFSNTDRNDEELGSLNKSNLKRTNNSKKSDSSGGGAQRASSQFAARANAGVATADISPLKSSNASLRGSANGGGDGSGASGCVATLLGIGVVQRAFQFIRDRGIIMLIIGYGLLTAFVQGR